MVGAKSGFPDVSAAGNRAFLATAGLHQRLGSQPTITNLALSLQTSRRLHFRPFASETSLRKVG